MKFLYHTGLLTCHSRRELHFQNRDAVTHMIVSVSHPIRRDLLLEQPSLLPPIEQFGSFHITRYVGGFRMVFLFNFLGFQA